MIVNTVTKNNLGSWFDSLGLIEAGKVNPALPTNEITPVGYIPTATGNVLNRNSFVVDINADVWFIDYAGDALKMSGASGVIPNVRFGTSAPSVLGADKKGDEYLVTPSGTNSTHATDSYVFDGSQWNKRASGNSASVNQIQLSYNPTPTGNPSANYNQFVKGLNGKTYFIDGSGKSILVDSTIELKPTLSPVKNFTTTSGLATLAGTANDGDSWIVTDGTNKGDIALWDAVNAAWIYYSPANGEYTTVTTGLYAGTSWFYQSSTDTWIQDLNVPPPPPLPTQPTAGNIALPSQSFGNSRKGFAVIQNNDVTAWGIEGAVTLTSGDAQNTHPPRRVSWSWNNLTNPMSRIAQYTPKFVDVVTNAYASFAVDHVGKVWVCTGNTNIAGTSMTPAPTYGFVPIPFFQTFNEKVVKIVVSNWDRNPAVITEYGNVYLCGDNSYGQHGNGTTTASNTTWVKMNLPAGKYAKDIKLAYNMSSSVSGVLCTDNSLYACGRNQYSAIASGTANVLTPAFIASDVLDFATDGETMLVVKTDHTLHAKGRNTSGECGNGTYTNITAALTQISGITDAKKVWMQGDWYGRPVSCYLTTSGVVKFTGFNNDGCFGMSPQDTTRNTWAAPSFSAQGSIVDVVMSRNVTTVLTSTGDVWNAGHFPYRGLGKTSANAVENEKFYQVSLPSPAIGIRYTGYYDGVGNDQETVVALLQNGSVVQFGGYGYPNVTNNSVMYSPQTVPILHFDNGSAIAGYPTNLTTQIATLSSIAAGSYTSIIDGASSNTTFTIPYASNQAGYVNVVPVITGTWNGSAVSVSNIQSLITASSTAGNLVFTATVTTTNNPSLTPPNTQALVLNVSFGALSTTASGNVVA